MGVAEWFSGFCTGLRIDQVQRASVGGRTGRIAGQLNYDFRGLDSKTANRFYVGSYGRSTAIPSVSDVDVLYELPAALYAKYDAYASNGQSALLSAVRDSLRNTYPTSAIAGDGQVVVISFNDGIRFEVLPAFLNQGGGYTFADSNGGGTWRTCKPKQEMQAFAGRNVDCNGNLVELARMVRAWRDYNNVPMSGMLIDTLTYQFIAGWAHRDKSYLYYDFMTRRLLQLPRWPGLREDLLVGAWQRFICLSTGAIRVQGEAGRAQGIGGNRSSKREPGLVRQAEVPGDLWNQLPQLTRPP